jgi:hypothetical protein
MSAWKTNEPEVMEICGKAFHCTVCGNERLPRRTASLNTSLATSSASTGATAMRTVSSAPSAAISTGSCHRDG